MTMCMVYKDSLAPKTAVSPACFAGPTPCSLRLCPPVHVAISSRVEPAVSCPPLDD